jgi:HAD superfamily hydrolase (TIGR01662 family)
VSVDRLRAAIGVGPLLLDFDGPVCSIFAGFPAPLVAAKLVAQLRAANIDVPAVVATAPDPLAVLRWTGQACSPDRTQAIDKVLCGLELHAVASAAPTPGGHEVVLAARKAGRQVAIVSNNSAGAVRAYLAAYGLENHVVVVVGRSYGRPDEMKPKPAPILDAVRALDAEPDDCVMVGDSLTDIEGARAAGVRVVGYANRPYKIEAFRGADAVVTTMVDIVAMIGAMSARE